MATATAALEAAAAAAREAERERNCAAVCHYCAHIGQVYEDEIAQAAYLKDGDWWHDVTCGDDTYRAFCWAGVIHAATLQPPPA